MSVVFKPGDRKTSDEVSIALSSVFDAFVDFADPVLDVPIVANEIFLKNIYGNLSDLVSKDDREPSALQQIQELCLIYCLSVVCDVRFVHRVIKRDLIALTFAGSSVAFLAALKDFYAADETELGKLLTASE